MLLKLRLGLNVAHASLKCLHCKTSVADGVHALTCKHYHGLTNIRHTTVKYALYGALKQKGFRLELERNLGNYCNLLPNADTQPVRRASITSTSTIDRGKLMDIVRTDVQSGNTQFIDVTVVHPDTVAGNAAMQAEKRKEKLYNSKWSFVAGQQLVPFAIETGGAWGKQAVDFISSVAETMRCADEAELPLAYSHNYRRITERVAVAVQKSVTSHIEYFLRDQRRQINDGRIASRRADASESDSDSDDVSETTEIRRPGRKFGKKTKSGGSILGSPSKRVRAAAAAN